MNLLKLFFRDDEKIGEPNWEALRSKSIYPDLIGRTVEADEFTPHWLRCGCGMLVMTTEDLSGQTTRCSGCLKTAHDAVDGKGAVPLAYQKPVMKQETERSVSFALILFCIVAAGAVGHSVMTGGSRPSDHMLHLD